MHLCAGSARVSSAGVRRWLFAALLALNLGVVVMPAEAQTSDARDEARALFAEGSAHYQARRYAEAFAALERSHALVDSPNTELLVARCLRELGRRVDAALAFEHAEKEARRRVAQGEAKYAQTADAAATEGEKIRASLGTLRVHVGRPAGVTVTADGRAVPLSPQGDATVLHDAGTATVVVKDASGAEQRQTVTVLAGAAVKMEFAGERSAPAAPPPPPPLAPERKPEPTRKDEPGASWAVPAAWISGAVAAAGLGTFIGFGLSSNATYDDLAQRCGPSSCGPQDKADADSGQRAQTIANVGLGVAVGAAALTAVFIVIAATSRTTSARFDGSRIRGL
jgi:hypothetical protein